MEKEIHSEYTKEWNLRVFVYVSATEVDISAYKTLFGYTKLVNQEQ